jgi:aldehyde dehydrogenase (NAD+)
VIGRSTALPWTCVDDHYVDGAFRPSTGGDRLTVVDPATEDAWGCVPGATPDDVEAALAAADRAFRTGRWPRLAPAERAAVLVRAAAELERHTDALAATITRENGSPVAETLGAAGNAAAIFRYFAGLAEHLERPDIRPFPAANREDRETVVRREPLGVCVLIAPWNFPINLVVSKLAPALLAGCTTVIKPASATPLSIRFVVAALEAAGVPAGVVNLVTGPARVGDALVRHPSVAKVAFTGSTPVGRRIAAVCGELLRPVTLELGGKSAAVVLPDANLAAMSRVLIRSCLRNTGQTCYIATRILAPARRYDEVLAMVTDTVAAARQGDPFDPDTVFGPVATKAQYDTVLGYLETARHEGARATTGGRTAAIEPGYFVAPTVLAGVTPSMRVAREEIFGPVLCVLRYEDEAEAVEIANGTGFGLGGLVFSTDPARAMAVAERLDTGSVGLNVFATNHNAPFGGRGQSGLGVEYGVEGLAAYLAYKSIHRSIG